MTLIHYIASQFNPAYLRPSYIVRALNELTPCARYSAGQDTQRRRLYLDRRCSIDRRQTNARVLLDMRSAYSRRFRSGRRDSEGNPLGLDVYV